MGVKVIVLLATLATCHSHTPVTKIIPEGKVFNGQMFKNASGNFHKNLIWPTKTSLKPTPPLVRMYTLHSERKRFSAKGINFCFDNNLPGGYLKDGYGVVHFNHVVAHAFNAIASYINVNFIHDNSKCNLKVEFQSDLESHVAGLYGGRNISISATIRDARLAYQVVVHEICHAMGLDHNDVSKSIMSRGIQGPNYKQVIYRADITTLRKLWGRRLKKVNRIRQLMNEEEIDENIVEVYNNITLSHDLDAVRIPENCTKECMENIIQSMPNHTNNEPINRLDTTFDDETTTAISSSTTASTSTEDFEISTSNFDYPDQFLGEPSAGVIEGVNISITDIGNLLKYQALAMEANRLVESLQTRNHYTMIGALVSIILCLTMCVYAISKMRPRIPKGETTRCKFAPVEMKNLV